MQALSLSLLGRPSRAWIIAIPLALLSAYAAAQLASDEAAFNAAIDDIAMASARLLRSLETFAPRRSREAEAAKARARAAARFGS